ncbi:uncharacterized protein AMSG_11841 [Thecamonas trahens ATCC 50062]|uniref:Uncharacterized protein n=1 Tax=Thecamonas trahens ATCC 50062 TaxID=461836 RepID=A0A0L0DAE2_THETB|nr:hypothetical protein AMSG_11841 [Thecamonas trahens ATCC 50062]KNC49051.1 hypothetical protein AMSG_11841 [Thecamonas trahens ATCC 50062]|eukprot:XP_013758220.1 hypothetical protein AMSG_11841 [Thecamonas trahens ATCC 50062]
MDSLGGTPLHCAVRYKHVACAEVLLEAGEADFNAADRVGSTVVHLAARYYDPETLNLLLDYGEELELDATDKTGATALVWALRSGSRAAAEELIAAGADVNLADSDDKSPLHLAAVLGASSVCSALLDAGAQVDNADAKGATPLYWAARRGHLNIVDMLVNAGASLNEPDEAGWTPLHWSARFGHTPVAHRLIDAGADKTAVTTGGKTIEDCVPRQNTRMLSLITGRSFSRSAYMAPLSKPDDHAHDRGVDELDYSGYDAYEYSDGAGQARRSRGRGPAAGGSKSFVTQDPPYGDYAYGDYSYSQ